MNNGLVIYLLRHGWIIAFAICANIWLALIMSTEFSVNVRIAHHIVFGALLTMMRWSGMITLKMYENMSCKEL